MSSVKKVRIASLKLATYNPSTRTKNVKMLQESIEKVGLLQPVLVTKANEVVDGHRRIKAFQELGLTEIPTLLVSGDRDEMYAEVNGQKRNLNGLDALEIYLLHPPALSMRTRNRMMEMEEVLGRTFVKQMWKQGFSLTVFATAKRVVREADAPRMLVKTVKWMVKHRARTTVNKALAGGVPAADILKAVRSNRPMKSTFQVS